MPVIFPLTDDAAQTMNINGYDYLFQWNITDNSWKMDIIFQGTNIINGVALLTGNFLLQPYSLGIGDFMVANSNNVLSDPTRDGFSTGEYILAYYTQDEIDALNAGD